MTGEFDPWPRLVAEIWGDRVKPQPDSWPADRVIAHVCEDEKSEPAPTPSERRVLDLLEAGPRSVGELAEALGLRVGGVSVLLSRMQRRGFVEHHGRTWMAKPSA